MKIQNLLKTKKNRVIAILLIIVLLTILIISLTITSSYIGETNNVIKQQKQKNLDLGTFNINLIEVNFNNLKPIFLNPFLIKLNAAIKFLESQHLPYSQVNYNLNGIVSLNNSSYYGLDSKDLIDVNFGKLLDDVFSNTIKSNDPLTMIVTNACDEAFQSCNSSGIWSRYAINQKTIVYSVNDTIGVLAHEITHFFGSVDLYYQGGLGDYSLLSHGMWNYNYSGNNPAHIDSYTLNLMGWWGLIKLNSQYFKHTINIKPIENNGHGYVIDGFILELRNDSNIPIFDSVLIYKFEYGQRPLLFDQVLNNGESIRLGDTNILFINNQLTYYKIFNFSFDYTYIAFLVAFIIEVVIIYVSYTKRHKFTNI